MQTDPSHGHAVGAGLVADGSIATKARASSKAIPGSAWPLATMRPCDHATIIWPLLCGMANAKHYLLLCEAVSGKEAKRIGLFSLTVNDADPLPCAVEVAGQLANGSQSAICRTKQALNNWLRLPGPSFDGSLAMEFMGFTGPDVREGTASLRERRAPASKPDSPFLGLACQTKKLQSNFCSGANIFSDVVCGPVRNNCR